MRATGWVLFALVAVLAVPAALVLYLLPTDDVPLHPDAVVVLGGAGSERARLGIELAERYDAILVLSSSAAVYGERLGRTCSADALCLEPEPETTRGEAQEIARLADQEGWQHITVATAAFHTSRARFLFRQCLGDRVSVVGALRDGQPPITPRQLVQEGLGIIAGATVQRAC